MGIGDPKSDLWKENLMKNRCADARIFIPVDWTGDGVEGCGRPADLGDDMADPPMVKNVKIS